MVDIAKTLADGGKEVAAAVDKRISDVTTLIDARGEKLTSAISERANEVTSVIDARGAELTNCSGSGSRKSIKRLARGAATSPTRSTAGSAQLEQLLSAAPMPSCTSSS